MSTLITAAPIAHAAEPQGLGFELRPESSANEIGLPVYPGAVQRKDNRDDAAGLTLALWGGKSGFRLSLLKFTARDSLDRVAAFYREAMASYGTVLDCSKPGPAPADKKVLACDETVPAGSQVYKVGTADKYRMASLKAVDGRVEFELVRIETAR